MLLQKWFIFNETHEKKNKNFWIQVSDTFQIKTLNWVKILQDTNRETDGFIKLLTKDQDQELIM